MIEDGFAVGLSNSRGRLRFGVDRFGRLCLGFYRLGLGRFGGRSGLDRFHRHFPWVSQRLKFPAVFWQVHCGVASGANRPEFESVRHILVDVTPERNHRFRVRIVSGLIVELRAGALGLALRLIAREILGASFIGDREIVAVACADTKCLVAAAIERRGAHFGLDRLGLASQYLIGLRLCCLPLRLFMQRVVALRLIIKRHVVLGRLTCG